VKVNDEKFMLLVGVTFAKHDAFGVALCKDWTVLQNLVPLQHGQVHVSRDEVAKIHGG